jgi:hypothetical protein
MARPTRAQKSDYRTPVYVPASHRWRLRINHAHGQKDFWWKAEAGRTSTCPPQVIAAAVAVQDQWKALCEDWDWIGKAMKLDQPDKDWSKPVWVDREKAQQIVDRVNQQTDQETYAAKREALHTVAFPR